MKLPFLDALVAVYSRLQKREKTVLYVTAVVVVLLLLERLIILPIYANLKSLDKEIVDQEKTMRDDARIVGYKDRIRAENTKYSSFVNIPASEEEAMTVLLKEIEGLASKSGVYLVDMKPGGVRGEAANKKYVINVTCEGKMEQITDFMYNIESTNKLLKVERYQINPKSKDSSTAQCSMSVSQVAIP
jgi:Tfp pilus assembly protein PilO